MNVDRKDSVEIITFSQAFKAAYVEFSTYEEIIGGYLK